MTVVLVKREPAATAAFRRSFDSLQDLFAFTAGFCARHRVDVGLLPTVDLAVEELFTNMVKYSPGGAAGDPDRHRHHPGRRRGRADRL